MKQAHVYITGFVQGVGFRHFVRDTAVELRLTGWVRNLRDGRVEALFQSSTGSDQEDKKKIAEMITHCQKGSFLAEVERVDVAWEEPEAGVSDFSIR